MYVFFYLFGRLMYLLKKNNIIVKTQEGSRIWQISWSNIWFLAGEFSGTA